jgi:hypothetical protein
MSASRGKDAIHEDVSPDPDQCVPKRLFLDDASLVFSAPWPIMMPEFPGPHTTATRRKLGYTMGTQCFARLYRQMDKSNMLRDE